MALQEQIRAPFLTPQQMADVAGLKRVTIYKWIERGWIHANRGSLGAKSTLYIPMEEANRVLRELALPLFDEQAEMAKDDEAD